MRIKNKLTDEKEVFLQTQQKKKSCKIKFATSKPTAVGKNTSPEEKVTFSRLEKCRCSPPLMITYYRKSENWNCSFNQFLGLQKSRFLETKQTTFLNNASQWQPLVPLTLRKFLCDYF